MDDPIRHVLVKLVRRTQKRVADKFPAEDAKQRNEALEGMIRAIRGERQ